MSRPGNTIGFYLTSHIGESSSYNFGGWEGFSNRQKAEMVLLKIYEKMGNYDADSTKTFTNFYNDVIDAINILNPQNKYKLFSSLDPKYHKGRMWYKSDRSPTTICSTEDGYKKLFAYIFKEEYRNKSGTKASPSEELRPQTMFLQLHDVLVAEPICLKLDNDGGCNTAWARLVNYSQLDIEKVIEQVASWLAKAAFDDREKFEDLLMGRLDDAVSNLESLKKGPIALLQSAEPLAGASFRNYLSIFRHSRYTYDIDKALFPFSKDETDGSNTVPTLDTNGAHILDNDPYIKHNLYILGNDGGIGKTTLLLDYFKCKTDSGKTCFFIPLSECPDDLLHWQKIGSKTKICFTTRYIGQFFSSADTNMADVPDTTREIILNAFREERSSDKAEYTIIFDGYNEVRSAKVQAALAVELRELCLLSNVRVIITSRILFDDSELTNSFKTLTLTGLGKNAVSKYLKKHSRYSDGQISELLGSENMLEMLSIPYYLTLFSGSNSLTKGEEVPQNPGELLYRAYREQVKKESKEVSEARAKYKVQVINDFFVPFVAYKFESEGRMHANRRILLNYIDEAKKSIIALIRATNSDSIPYANYKYDQNEILQFGTDSLKYDLDVYDIEKYMLDSAILLPETVSAKTAASYTYKHQINRDFASALWRTVILRFLTNKEDPDAADDNTCCYVNSEAFYNSVFAEPLNTSLWSHEISVFIGQIVQDYKNTPVFVKGNWEIPAIKNDNEYLRSLLPEALDFCRILQRDKSRKLDKIESADEMSQMEQILQYQIFLENIANTIKNSRKDFAGVNFSGLEIFCEGIFCETPCTHIDADGEKRIIADFSNSIISRGVLFREECEKMNVLYWDNRVMIADINNRRHVLDANTLIPKVEYRQLIDRYLQKKISGIELPWISSYNPKWVIGFDTLSESTKCNTTSTNPYQVEIVLLNIRNLSERPIPTGLTVSINSPWNLCFTTDDSALVLFDEDGIIFWDCHEHGVCRRLIYSLEQSQLQYQTLIEPADAELSTEYSIKDIIMNQLLNHRSSVIVVPSINSNQFCVAGEVVSHGVEIRDWSSLVSVEEFFVCSNIVYPKKITLLGHKYKRKYGSNYEDRIIYCPLDDILLFYDMDIHSIVEFDLSNKSYSTISLVNHPRPRKIDYLVSQNRCLYIGVGGNPYDDNIGYMPIYTFSPKEATSFSDFQLFLSSRQINYQVPRASDVSLEHILISAISENHIFSVWDKNSCTINTPESFLFTEYRYTRCYCNSSDDLILITSSQEIVVIESVSLNVKQYIHPTIKGIYAHLFYEKNNKMVFFASRGIWIVDIITGETRLIERTEDAVTGALILADSEQLIWSSQHFVYSYSFREQAHNSRLIYDVGKEHVITNLSYLGSELSVVSRFIKNTEVTYDCSIIVKNNNESYEPKVYYIIPNIPETKASFLRASITVNIEPVNKPLSFGPYYMPDSDDPFPHQILLLKDNKDSVKELFKFDNHSGGGMTITQFETLHSIYLCMRHEVWANFASDLQLQYADYINHKYVVFYNQRAESTSVIYDTLSDIMIDYKDAVKARLSFGTDAHTDLLCINHHNMLYTRSFGTPNTLCRIKTEDSKEYSIQEKLMLPANASICGCRADNTVFGNITFSENSFYDEDFTDNGISIRKNDPYEAEARFSAKAVCLESTSYNKNILGQRPWN